jgi:NAD(P)-dependent dehydrogenase (short-subunit alcohol dehydrogenase family)
VPRRSPPTSPPKTEAVPVAAYLVMEPSLSILVHNNSGANWGAPFRRVSRRGMGSRHESQRTRRVHHLTKPSRPALSAAGSGRRSIGVSSTSARSTVLHVPEESARGLCIRGPARAAIPSPDAGARENDWARCTSRSSARARAVREQDDEADPRTHGRSVGVDVAALAHRAGATTSPAQPIFLASRAGSYVTGSVIAIDGGIATTL